MKTGEIASLVSQFRQGELDRRAFLGGAAALGISTGAAQMLARTVVAQNATPQASPAGSPAASPAATGAVTRSITRDEYFAQLAEFAPMEEPGNTGGTVIHGASTDIRVVNPSLSTDIYSGYIVGFVFNSLVTDSAIDGSLVPDLADYWEQSADGLTYTFYLNQNAAFHDGTPVTAADVVFSFDSIMDENTLSVRRSDLVQVVKSYRAIDDYTFELTALAPFATTLEKSAANVAILPKHIWESIPVADWGSAPGTTGQDPSQVIGSGPFTFVDWAPGDHVTIKRNDAYWDSERLPVIDTYTIRVVPEPSALMQTLVTGESDIVEVPPSQADDLKQGNPDLQIIDYDTTSFNYYIPLQDPAKLELFTDKKVRQAMLYALDRQLAVDQILFGYAIQANGTQPVLSNAYAPDQVNMIYDYNTDTANALLDEAGWADSDGDGIREKDGTKLSFEFLYSEGSATYVQLVPYMQQAWGEVGIEMTPTAMPFPALIESVIAGTFEMAIAGFQWDIDGDQGAMFRTDSKPPDGFNRARYSNPEYDRLNDEQLTELDPAKRRQLLIDQSNIINDDAAVGILFFIKDITGSTPRLHNFQPNGYSLLWSMPWVWVEE
jgi:peptide/nickel transport system substrate-binding protein